jgi:hypothetical protein
MKKIIYEFCTEMNLSNFIKRFLYKYTIFQFKYKVIKLQKFNYIKIYKVNFYNFKETILNYSN